MGRRFVKDLLTIEEFDQLRTAPLIAGRRHPTWYSVFLETPRRVEHLTNEAVARIGDAGHSDWLEKLKHRLTRLDDHEEAAAALAELRAFGGLLEAGFAVKPIPRADAATPDFIVNAGDGEVVVAVFAKLEGADQKQLREHASDGGDGPKIARSSHGVPGSRTTKTATVRPRRGVPNKNKPNDGVQANLISWICAAKDNETQLPRDMPAVLWIDLRSFDLVKPEQAAPLMMSREGLTSGVLWYAFYGWKGAPIYDPRLRKSENVVRMGHHGRFHMSGRKKSKLSAAIVVLPETLTFFENPWAANPISDRTRHASMRLPDYDLSRSVCSWSPEDALTSVELAHSQIETMDNWSP